jgi:cholesterol transport system auxiliary component
MRVDPMTLPISRRLPALALVLPLMLSGCLSLTPKPPKVLLTLTPVASLPPGSTQNSATEPTITIMVPVVPQSLATARIPVQTGDTIAYVTDVFWVEAPQRLFARLMSDTIAAKTGRVVLSSAQSFADPGARLSGELRNFGVESATGEAVVTFDATLVRGEGGKFEKKRFEARVPVSPIAAMTVGPALDKAANQVASDVADWVGK